MEGQGREEMWVTAIVLLQKKHPCDPFPLGSHHNPPKPKIFLKTHSVEYFDTHM